MSKSSLDKLNYLIAVIAEFAKHHKLTQVQAFDYLQCYKGIDFADDFYDVEHTQSFDNTVEDLTIYCKRMGGQLG